MNHTFAGDAAFRIAETDGVTLRAFTDPIDGSRPINRSEADEIAKLDPRLVFVFVTRVDGRWIDARVSDAQIMEWLSSLSDEDRCGWQTGAIDEDMQTQARDHFVQIRFDRILEIARSQRSTPYHQPYQRPVRV